METRIWQVLSLCILPVMMVVVANDAVVAYGHHHWLPFSLLMSGILFGCVSSALVLRELMKSRRSSSKAGGPDLTMQK